jgi:diacylglycerol kinase (ATP)
MPTSRRGLTRKLLIISSGAGGVTPAVHKKLRRAFADYELMEFEPSADFRRRLEPGAMVVVAGGDGTIGFAARALVDKPFVLGILSLGTYNNFARGLGLPKSLDRAIEVIRAGDARPVTLGRVNGRPFLEAAAVGLFGEAIMMGEAAKERRFGELGQRLAQVSTAKPFSYVLSGDIEGEGRAVSLVFANTSSTGARIGVSANTPVEGRLELSINVGQTRRDLVRRIVASTVGTGHDVGLDMRFKFRKLKVRASPRVTVFADNEAAGRTPVDINADVGALKVMLPRHVAVRSTSGRRN